MSWSFSGCGKAAPLFAKMKADLSAYRCVEPEESIKQQALITIETAINAFPNKAAVKIEASGSQSPEIGPKGELTGKYTNSLSIVLTSLYGFIE
jgi:hypothetical protein